MISFFRARWRAIVLLLILACAAFLVARFPEFAPFALIGFALLLLFIASQLFWIRRILDLGERLVPGRPRRAWLAIIAGMVYLFVFTYSYSEWGLGHTIRAADYRPQSILIYVAFWWWFVGSLLAFVLVIAFGAADRAARAAARTYRKARTAIHQHSTAADAQAALLPPSRRRFLERTAVLVGATPFVAAGYGLLYVCERLTAFSDAWETMRRTWGLKSPLLACSPPRVSASFARSAHLSGCGTTRLI